MSDGPFAGGLLLARMFVRRRAFSASLTKHPAFAGRRHLTAHPRFPSGTTAQLHTCVFASPSTETAEHLSRRHHVGSAILTVRPGRQFRPEGRIIIASGCCRKRSAPTQQAFSVGRSDIGSFKWLEMGLPLRPNLLFSFAGRILAGSNGSKQGK